MPEDTPVVFPSPFESGGGWLPCDMPVSVDAFPHPSRHPSGGIINGTRQRAHYFLTHAHTDHYSGLTERYMHASTKHFFLFLFFPPPLPSDWQMKTYLAPWLFLLSHSKLDLTKF